MIDPAVPTLFATAGNTAAALHSNYQAISGSNPANIGESVSLYATGLGAVTFHNGLLVANQPPQASIDGLPAVVSFAGRAPGYQGLDQINLQIPGGIRRGVSVPVVIISGNRPATRRCWRSTEKHPSAAIPATPCRNSSQLQQHHDELGQAA
jgi:uncharacterized protein (TIGR03437 family)